MFRIDGKSLFILLLLLLCTTPAMAGRVFVDVEIGRGWLNLGGFSTEAVADTVLSGLNDFSEIDSAVEFGARLGYRISDSLEAGIAFTHQNHAHAFSDSNSLRKYDFPATWYELFAAYSPWQSGSLRLDVGASAGMVSISGSSHFSVIEESSIRSGYSGEAFSFSGFTTAELILAQNASLLVRVGYRQAKISDLDDSDGNIFVFEDDNVELDFSGLYSRIGLRFYIN